MIGGGLARGLVLCAVTENGKEGWLSGGLLLTSLSGGPQLPSDMWESLLSNITLGMCMYPQPPSLHTPKTHVSV